MQAETLGRGAGLDRRGRGRPSPSDAWSRVEEVANLAVFLLTDASGPMTGALVDQEQWVVGAAR